ncbi:homoserine O-acetyltransferase [Brevibacterium sp. BRM-1]|uniref:homoserine O-acetyltransferase MetX n=1 Tax=Brevibacterium sp. BRM-1 TaxID=2999062 RepID=UPI00227EC8FD|nr:homoserine O-acetyltransferase [Brevibacterium sp. BRM-1]WAL40803.1 homoserine O-acetyltransferase [Brevibacterium sp. BRM-1]
MALSVHTSAVDLGAFRLESGQRLPAVHLAYEAYGRLNAAGTNAVLVEHALTGDSHVASAGVDGSGAFAPGWWEAVVGPGRAIDTDEFFVVCANTLGGCSGSTGPASTAADGLPYGSRFPRVGIRDMARAELALSDALGIERWHAVIGGSMGGARALELALLAPQRVARAGILAAPAYSQADQIAWAHAQLRAIRMDPDYCGGDYAALGRCPAAGLGLARQIAHLTYRADADLNERFGRDLQPGASAEAGARAGAVPSAGAGAQGAYAIESYLDYQANKLVARFDANSYAVLTAALRDHDVRRGRSADLAEALAGARCRFSVAALSSDRLYPPGQVEQLAQALPGRVDYALIATAAGHDGFLTESHAVGEVLAALLAH